MNIFSWLNKAFEDNEPQTTMTAQPETVETPQRVVTVVKPTPKLYTAEDVHRDLTAFVLLFLSDIQQEIERKEVPATISQDAALLSEFGLTHSKNAVIAKNLAKEVSAHNEEYDRKKAALAFMADVWATFGTDAMVVRYDHFFQILEKYDMVCGSFDRYTGGIPQEALNALASLKDLWGKGQFRSEYGLPLSYAKGFTFRDESCDIVHLRNRARIPMRVSDKAVMRQFAKLCFMSPDYLGESEPRGLGGINDALFIAAPAADMKPLKMKVEFDHNAPSMLDAIAAADKKRNNSMNSLLYESFMEMQNRVIRAEETRLQSVIEKSNIARYCEIDFIETQPLPERKLYDPFICSLTPYGVLIHAKWGAEAEDATIKRYEQLRDEIIGKSKMLTV